MNTVFTFGGPNPYDQNKSELIELRVSESGKRFTVAYGMMLKEGLPYDAAAKELGECIFHHLACDSLLDNQGQ